MLIINPGSHVEGGTVEQARMPMVRIGDRPQHRMKPLSANTMARIQYGLDKYGVRPTIIDQRNQSGSRSARIRSAEGDPLNAQATGYSSYLFRPTCSTWRSLMRGQATHTQ